MPRRNTEVSGPAPAALADIEDLNRVFSEAFTDRYRRDGLMGVRVPPLNPQVWRYALELAGPGALIWRGSRGQIVAFNMVHRSGDEGWMGPLAVAPDYQGSGLGRRIVQAGVDLLVEQGARVIGLETMPRTVDNIGFYSRMGFEPGHLTITVTGVLEELAQPPEDDQESDTDLAELVARCGELTSELLPGTDYSSEVLLTRKLGMGDVSLTSDNGGLAGYALWHGAPLAAGRGAEELRVLKLVARDLAAADRLLAKMAFEGLRLGLDRLAIRCETRERELFRHLIGGGFRTHWTDLRMTLAGYGQRESSGGLALSNWEI